jgi:hypothetical protein
MKILMNLKKLAQFHFKRPPQKIENLFPQLVNPEVRNSNENEEQEKHSA